jgi:hypothetical protein
LYHSHIILREAASRSFIARNYEMLNVQILLKEMILPAAMTNALGLLQTNKAFLHIIFR